VARVQPRELDQQVDQLARQITESLADRKVATLAILEFPGLDGRVTDLSRYLTEELTTRLFRTGRFQIVERQHLKRVLDEQRLGATGLIDEASASRLGRVLGADVLATGTIMDLDTHVKINARLVAAETGSLFSVANVRIPMNRELAKLLGRKPGEADPSRFDGTWEVSVACTATEGALGYTNRFPATVKGGVLHGQYGTEGVAASLTLDGRINPNGTATILASGLTGDTRFNVKAMPKGRPYSYHIEATFLNASGTGRRVEVRPCSVTFIRK